MVIVHLLIHSDDLIKKIEVDLWSFEGIHYLLVFYYWYRHIMIEFLVIISNRFVWVFGSHVPECCRSDLIVWGAGVVHNWVEDGCVIALSGFLDGGHCADWSHTPVPVLAVHGTAIRLE